ncbi:MAG: UMP kinase [Methanomicrobiaceae archaeon]|nr:UMP kinase [Methanomicrobiaceae archaeon]
MKTIVLSLGGSVLVPSLESNTIQRYREALIDISRECALYVVIGGGGEARRYITAARKLGIDEAFSDELGIAVTRLNAALLIGALGEAAYPKIATNYEEARTFSGQGRIVVMGGVTPAQTTDAVSAVLAESVHADVMINATSVDGIYSADPRKDPDARRFEYLTPEELLRIIIGSRLDAGANTVIDIVAAKVIQRSGIPLVVIDGRDPETLKTAVLQGEFSGTVVSESRQNPLSVSGDGRR